MTATDPVTVPSAARRRARRLDALAQWVGIAGAAATVGSFDQLPWLSGDDGRDRVFTEISAYGGTGAARGIVGAWFPWLAWVALAAVVVLVLVARCVTARPRFWRSAAVLATSGVAGADIAATAAARGVGGMPSGFGPGLWLAVAGCTLLAVCVLLPVDRDDAAQ